MPLGKAHFEFMRVCLRAVQTRRMHTKYPECKDKYVQYANIGQKHIHDKILLTSIIGKSSD